MVHRRRPSRLPEPAYEEGAIHIVLSTIGRASLFEDWRLAAAIFHPWKEHDLTLAACLMPNHLHWLTFPDRGIIGEAARLKSWTTRLAWRLGYSGRLWQRGIFDRVSRRSEDVFAMAVYIVDNPVIDGLVAKRSDYPFQILYEDRFVI